ncbi:hypothetical protein [Pelagicoccus sp. SDUM812002]|uniref:hypothetical protein n=1 Tax=Pelagicoccus sp. SDUM812002 TaxID=3041266 RepID=UPI00281008E2|nr:hypothetical protein [Pelagicoccus sp. SDUM812002]MDQ8187342.1 hypothetical protein [Pelagicoccus sp. SDUM812002]
MPFPPKLKPKAQAYELDAFLAPAHWFFCRRIEIPSDLEKGEEEGFALLELENLSPFPLDHLHYGYRLDRAGRFAFVFAAYKRRFEKVDQTSWRRRDAILPDFLLGLHTSSKSGESGLILVTEKSLAAFSFDEKSELPAAFYSEALEFEGDEGEEPPSLMSQIVRFESVAKSRLKMSRVRIWHANTEAKWVGQTAWFGAVDSSDFPVAKVDFSRAQLWKADLRDQEQVDQAQKEERQNALLWKGLGGIAALVGIILLGELFWGASAAYLSYRNSKIAEMTPLVQEIQSLQATSNTLRGFLESDLQPFEMIDALIPLQQYPNIVYRKFETEGPDVLVIDAKAANQTQVTEFKKRLERFDKIASVELSKQVNKPSGSTFTTTIRFKFGAFYQLAGGGQ